MQRQKRAYRPGLPEGEKYLCEVNVSFCYKELSGNFKHIEFKRVLFY